MGMPRRLLIDDGNQCSIVFVEHNSVITNELGPYTDGHHNWHEFEKGDVTVSEVMGESSVKPSGAEYHTKASGCCCIHVKVQCFTGQPSLLHEHGGQVETIQEIQPSYHFSMFRGIQ